MTRDAPWAVAGTSSTNSAGLRPARSSIASLSWSHMAVRFATTRILAFSAMQDLPTRWAGTTLARRSHQRGRGRLDGDRAAEAGDVELGHGLVGRRSDLGLDPSDPAARVDPHVR